MGRNWLVIRVLRVLYADPCETRVISKLLNDSDMRFSSSDDR